MATTLVITGPIANQLRSLASSKLESAGVLLAKLAPTLDGDFRLLAANFRAVPASAYAERKKRSLKITSDGYVSALAEAEKHGYVPIWLHTHVGPGSSPKPSLHDKKVDTQLSDLFRLRSGSDCYGSFIISLDAAGDFQFTGHLDDGASHTRIDRLLIAGSRISLRFKYEEEAKIPSELFSRNIRAFGGDVQNILGELKLAVIGCGGTGSAVAEQLVRLGARNLQLVDGDILSASNTTRVYGSYAKDIGRPKVEVLTNHLLAIAPDASISPIQSMVTDEMVAKQLIGADVLFACTDDNAGRLVLSRMSTYLIMPIIDCGVILTNDTSGRVEGIYGRVTVLYPGSACLVCRNRIDMQRASSEMLNPEERQLRVDEGYAPALHGIEPAVVPYTTAVAATAVSELLERLIGYGPDPVPSEVVLRLHEREVSTNVTAPRGRHYCDERTGKIGRGITTPFLEQTWQV